MSDGNDSLETTWPLWLRDTYVKLSDQPLFEISGYHDINNVSELDAYNNYKRVFDFFVPGNIMYKLLSKYQTRIENYKEKYLIIVIPILRNIYYEHRNDLPAKEKQEVERLVGYHTYPEMYNINNYYSLRKKNLPYPLFQLEGNLSVYDIISIPVSYYIERIDEQEPLIIELDGTSIVIKLFHRPYDFFDIKEDVVLSRSRPLSRS